MRLDVRLPIGLMFSVLGALLVGFSFFTDQASLDRSLGVNVNLWWGIVMLLFGVLMFLFGRRGAGTAKPTEESPEGSRIEQPEHKLGLETGPTDDSP